MGLFDDISKLFVSPVDTSSATRAVNNTSSRAIDRLNPSAVAADQVRNRLMELFSNPGAFEGTNAFQFARDQGVSALDRSAAARGQLGSGNHQREIAQFASGLASQDRGNEINRLMGFFGQTNPANAQIADVHLNRGRNIAGLEIGKENARVAGSNSLMGAVGGLAGRALGVL